MGCVRQLWGLGGLPVGHLLVTGLILAAFWLLLAGVYKPLILFLGAISVALAVYLVKRMDVADHEGHPVHLGLRAPLYWLWLFKEIVKANIDVAKIVLSPKMDLEPALLDFKAYQKTELGRVIYANSITLTPGTITLRLEEDGHMLIHALSKSGAEDLQEGTMDRQVEKMGMDVYSTIEKERGLTNAKPAAVPEKTEGETS